METLVTMDGGETARAVWIDRGLLYAGGQDNKLHVVDLATHAELKSWEVPWLISDIAVVGDRVFASLGPGDLVTWEERALSGAGAVRHVDANAPKFATDGDTLFWGTAWGEVRERGRGLVASISKGLGSISVDAEHIYAGYEDGKLRIFRRSDGNRVKIINVGSRLARAATGRGVLVTVANRTGEVTRWRLPDCVSEQRFVFDVSGASWGVIGVDVVGTRIVLHSYEELAIFEADGSRVFTWHPSGENRIEDVWYDGTHALMAVGPSVVRVAV